MQQPQKLVLTTHDDEKKWVAEIIGEDPQFKVRRYFLKEVSEGYYPIYDGVYQIYGKCDGITPFQKEYCIVQEGKMRRRLQFYEVMQYLPWIISETSHRVARLKHDIEQILDEILVELEADFLREEIFYQKEQLSFEEDEVTLRYALDKLNVEKETMIETYKRAQAKREEHEWGL